MALQAVSMKELKLELLLEPERAGDTVRRSELTRAGLEPPAVSTIHQALKRN